MKSLFSSTLAILATASCFLGVSGSLWAEDPKAEHKTAQEAASGDNDAVVKGEVVDLVCYTDSGASGAAHASCAKVCMNAGLPVGLKAEDGKVYVLVGDHKPMNAELVPYAAKTVTMKGKLVSRDGISLLENAELVK